MSNVGINIWLLGDALENPELGGAQPTVTDGDFNIGELKVLGGDDYAEGVFSLGPIHVDGQENWGRGDFSLGELQLLGGDDYAAADYTLGPIKVLADGEEDPGLEGGALTFIGLTVQGAGYTWGTGTGDVQLGELELLGSDYDYAEGDYSLGSIRIDANGTTRFFHGIVWLPGLEGDSSFSLVQEGITAEDIVKTDVAVIVKELLNIEGTLTILGTLTSDVLEEVVARSIEIVPILVTLADSFEIDGSEEIIAYKVVSAVEQMSADADLDTQATLLLSAAAALTLRDAIKFSEVLDFDEVANLLAQHTESLKANLDLLEQIQAQMLLVGNAIIAVDTAEESALADLPSTLATLQATIEEGAGVYINIRVGEDVVEGWVLNTDTLGYSEYTNFPFNSLAAVNGRHYAVAEDGLYELTGDDDAGEPIDAAIRTGLLDLGSHFIKDAKAAYLGYTSSGKLVLKVATTAKGQKEEWWYELKQGSAPSLRDGRVTIGRGLRAKYWQFEVVNTDGADFELDDIQVMYNILSRRIR